MTVSSTTTKNSYSGDGSTTTFAYAFKIFADADLTVILRSAAGTETVQTLTTNYTVTNAGNASGGNVEFVTAPASGVTVVIRRNMAQTQSTDYTANDPFPAESHEDALDRLTFIAQQQQEEVDRSIKLSRTNTMTSTEFTVGATDRANKILAFDGNGELSVTQELGTYKGTDATVTTEAYVVRDIIKSTTAAQLNNVYICVANAVVGDSLTDTDHFELLVDAVSAATSATNAANSASAASTSETNAATSESNASTSETNASNAQTAAETAQSAAETAQTAAETAQTAAEAALDTFDDRFLGAKASDPTVDNDGNALIDGALYFDTTNDIMKVYDLTNTTWRQLTLTSANQTNVNTVAGQISPTNNIATVAGADTNIGLVAGSIANVNTTASNIANVNSVAGNESNINSAVSNESNINAVVSNASNINAVAGNASNINAVSSDITNVNTVATNISSVNNFADVYRIAASAPTTSLDIGDLYFDTTSDTLKVYGASGWQSAGSSINGTSQRYHYDISGTPTSVTGADANGNTLSYDAGYVDVYVNGVRMSQADITVTSGDTVTFTEALADGDEVDIVGYGTFAVASLNADNLDSGTVPDARITGAYTGITNLTMSGNLTVDTNTLYVDSANNRVGVGTVSPSYILDIQGQNAGTDAILRVKTLGTQTYSDAFLFLETAGSGITGIAFGDSADNNVGLINYDHSDNSLYIRTNATEAMRIDSSGNVGIGTSSPNVTLHVQGANASSGDSNHSVVIDDTTSMAQGVGGGIVFRGNYGSGLTNGGFIQTEKSNGTSGNYAFDLVLGSRANGSSPAETMRITSNGNVLVGKTNTGFGTAGVELRNNGVAGKVFMTRSGGDPLSLNRLSSDGEILGFYKDSTLVGNIGTFGSALYISSPDGTDAGLRVGNSTVLPVTTTGALRDNAINLGSASARWKDLYLSGGAYIGGTGSANYLDDYEEGSYNPSLTPTSGTVATNSSFDTFQYTKTGRFVHVTGVLTNVVPSSASGDLDITLPFTIADDVKRSAWGAGNILVTESTVTGDNLQAGQVFLPYIHGENVNFITVINGADYLKTNGTTDIRLTVSFITE